MIPLFSQLEFSDRPLYVDDRRRRRPSCNLGIMFKPTAASRRHIHAQWIGRSTSSTGCIIWSRTGVGIRNLDLGCPRRGPILLSQFCRNPTYLCPNRIGQVANCLDQSQPNQGPWVDGTPCMYSSRRLRHWGSFLPLMMICHVPPFTVEDTRIRIQHKTTHEIGLLLRIVKKQGTQHKRC